MVDIGSRTKLTVWFFVPACSLNLRPMGAGQPEKWVQLLNQSSKVYGSVIKSGHLGYALCSPVITSAEYRMILKLPAAARTNHFIPVGAFNLSQGYVRYWAVGASSQTRDWVEQRTMRVYIYIYMYVYIYNYIYIY